MTWKVTQAPFNSHTMHSYLEQGWEPFAVTGNDVFLRHQVTAQPDASTKSPIPGEWVIVIDPTGFEDQLGPIGTIHKVVSKTSDYTKVVHIDRNEEGGYNHSRFKPCKVVLV